MKKEIRSEFVNESLAEFKGIQDILKASAGETLQGLMKESVRKELSSILNEADDKEIENDEPEVKDTTEEPESLEAEESQDIEGAESTDDAVETPEIGSEETFVADDDVEAPQEPENQWAEFEKYKVPGTEDEYDTTNASDEDAIRMFKLMNDEDEVILKDNGDGTIGIKDNETGAEYIIDVNGNANQTPEAPVTELEPEVPVEDVPTEEEGDEEAIFEIELDDEEAVAEPESPVEKPIEENEGMAIPNIRRKTVKPELPHINDNGMVNVQESKYNELFDKFKKLNEENEELKDALKLFKTKLQENAVLNNNLAKIVKIVHENSTTKEEKSAIIERFDREAKTIQDGNKLYESIKAELKKTPIVNENVIADKQILATGSQKVNETVLFEGTDFLKRFNEIAKIK